MVAQDYYLRLNIGKGAHTFDWQSLDTDELAAVHMLDGMNVSWSVPTGGAQRYPDQPDAMEAAFTLRTLSAANLSALAKGVDVALELYAPDDLGAKVMGFYGRVTDVQLTPVKEADQTWLYYGVQAVDYTADLAELSVQPGAWPAEDLDDRFTTRVAPAFPAAAPWDNTGLALAAPTHPVRAQAFGGGKLLDVALAVLGDCLLDAPLSAPVLVPKATYAGGLQGFTNQWWPRELIGTADQLPGVAVLEADGIGGLRLTIDWSDAGSSAGPDGTGPAVALDGGLVPTGTLRWRDAKGADRPNAVAVTGTLGGVDQTVEVDLDDVTGGIMPADRIQLAYQTELSAVADARTWAIFYLTDFTQLPDSWDVDTFTYRVPQAQLGQLRLVPDHAQAEGNDYWAVWPSVQPVVVYGIEDDKAPTGRTFVAGRFVALTLRINEGRVELDCRLRRGAPPAASLTSPFTMDELNTAIPDLTDQPRHNANKVTNPGFESALAGSWAAAGANCTVARVTTQQAHGVASAAMTLTGVAGGLGYFSADAAADIPVVPGETWRCSLYWRAAASARNAGAYVQFYTAGGAFISQPVFSAVTVAGSWVRADSGALVVPATAAKARIVPVISVNAGDTGMVHYVDSVLMEKTTELLPYEGDEYPTRYLDPALSWDDFNLVRSA